MQVDKNHKKETGLKPNICISTEIETFLEDAVSWPAVGWEILAGGVQHSQAQTPALESSRGQTYKPASHGFSNEPAPRTCGHHRPSSVAESSQSFGLFYLYFFSILTVKQPQSSWNPWILCLTVKKSRIFFITQKKS